MAASGTELKVRIKIAPELNDTCISDSRFPHPVIKTFTVDLNNNKPWSQSIAPTIKQYFKDNQTRLGINFTPEHEVYGYFVIEAKNPQWDSDEPVQVSTNVIFTNKVVMLPRAPDTAQYADHVYISAWFRVKEKKRNIRHLYGHSVNSRRERRRLNDGSEVEQGDEDLYNAGGVNAGGAVEQGAIEQDASASGANEQNAIEGHVNEENKQIEENDNGATEENKQQIEQEQQTSDSGRPLRKSQKVIKKVKEIQTERKNETINNEETTQRLRDVLTPFHFNKMAIYNFIEYKAWGAKGFMNLTWVICPIGSCGACIHLGEVLNLRPFIKHMFRKNKPMHNLFGNRFQMQLEYGYTNGSLGYPKLPDNVDLTDVSQYINFIALSLPQNLKGMVKINTFHEAFKTKWNKMHINAKRAFWEIYIVGTNPFVHV
eukprot:200795_1